jgi:hypothetical protein
MEAEYWNLSQVGYMSKKNYIDLFQDIHLS